MTSETNKLFYTGFNAAVLKYMNLFEIIHQTLYQQIQDKRFIWVRYAFYHLLPLSVQFLSFKSHQWEEMCTET